MRYCGLCTWSCTPCVPTAIGCQLRCHDAAERHKASPDVARTWRGFDHSRVSDLAMASGANARRLGYHLRRGKPTAEAVALAGGEAE